MSNETTTKVTVKTSTVVGILLTGGAIAAAAFIAGSRFEKQKPELTLQTPPSTNAPCAMTCAEALQRCPCPTTPTITPVPPTVEVQKPTCVYGPDLVITEINPETTRTAVTVRNAGTADIPRGTMVNVKLETVGTVLGVVGTSVGLPEGTKVTLSLPAMPAGTAYLKATVDPTNLVNESNYLTKTEIPDCFNGETNNTKEWSTVY